MRNSPSYHTAFHMLALVALFALLLPGCSSLPFSSTIDPDKLPTTIRVGLATDASPLAYQDTTSVDGLDARLAAGLSSYTNREIIYLPLPRRDLLEALNKNEVDVIMAGFTASEAKQRGLAATRSYLDSGLVPLMFLGEHKQLATTAGLKAADVRIGTVLDSAGPAFVRSLRAKGTHQVFATTQAGVNALLAKRIDVLIHDMPTCFHYASIHIEQGLIPGLTPLTRENIVWALRSKDRNLRLLLNAYLQEKEESGELTTLITNTLPFYHETSLLKNK